MALMDKLVSTIQAIGADMAAIYDIFIYFIGELNNAVKNGDYGKTLSGLTLTGTSTATVVKFAGEYNAGNSGTSVTINFTNGQKQKLTLTGNVTIALSFPGPGNYQLKLVQDGTGSRTAVWNGSVKYIGSTSSPEINTNSNGETLVSIYYDGSSYYIAASKVGA